MNNDRTWVGVSSVMLLLSATACEEKVPPGQRSVDGATQTATGTATGKAPEVPSAKTSTPLTKGELSTEKLKVAFTIVLPPGLRERFDGHGRGMISYRKSQDGFDGYNVTIGIDRTEKGMLATVKAGILADFERQKAAKKGSILEQGDWEGGGWYLATTFEEGGRPHVTMMSRVVKGDAVLMCRGDGEGQVANTPAATAKVLLETCKSLIITSP